MKMDMSKPYGSISGHPSASFEQGGILFKASGESLEDIPDLSFPVTLENTRIIPSDQVQSAKDFLLNILKDRSLSKSAIYKEVEGNNQDWSAVKDAAVLLNVVKFQFQRAETWKLPDEVKEI